MTMEPGTGQVRKQLFNKAEYVPKNSCADNGCHGQLKRELLHINDM